MNDTLNPKMPAEGEQMLCLRIQRGQFTVEDIGTVRNRSGFKLTCDEFTTTHGSRYHCDRLHPCILDNCNFERFPDSPAFIYCRASDKDEAEKSLRSHYVKECIRSENELQADARKLHEYAGECVRPEPKRRPHEARGSAASNACFGA